MRLIAALVLSASGLFAQINVVGGSIGSVNYVAQQIFEDMQGPNEGLPHGMPSTFLNYAGPAMTQSINPPANTVGIVWWAVLYQAQNNPTSTNTQVQIKNAALYVLSTSGVWTAYPMTGTQAVSQANIGSETWSEDWSGGSFTYAATYEADGSIGITAGSGNGLPSCPNGATNNTKCLAHIYGPYPRISFTPSQVAGVVSVMSARLQLINGAGTDDRANSSFLLDTGADYYTALTGGGVVANPGAGNGKFKYVTNNWRSFCMTDLTPLQLMLNPPPVSFAGINP